jgi:taurine dioxygenase
MQFRDVAENFGTLVDDIDLRRAGDQDLQQILEHLLDARFVVIPGQELSNDDYVAFGRRWGTPVLLIARNNRLGSHPEMIVQSNRAETPEFLRNVANHWHCDSSYEEVSATFTMLYGVEAPENDGYTLFADLVAAFEALPLEKQRAYEEMTVLHKVSGATPLPGEHINDRSKLPEEVRRTVVELDPVTKPLVARHPVTGRKALYGLGGSAYGIEGMDAAQGNELILELRRYATQDRFVSRHKLMPGEVLIWDNFSVMHRATPIEYSNAPGRTRLNYRISVKGVPGFAASLIAH